MRHLKFLLSCLKIFLCTILQERGSNPLQIARPSHPPEQITIKEAKEEKFITTPSEQSGPVEVRARLII